MSLAQDAASLAALLSDGFAATREPGLPHRRRQRPGHLTDRGLDGGRRDEQCARDGNGNLSESVADQHAST